MLIFKADSMMNISSILCTVYGKNLQSEFFNQFGRLFHIKLTILRAAGCGLRVASHIKLLPCNKVITQEN